MTSTSMQWSAMMPMPSRLTGPSCSGRQLHVRKRVHGGAELQIYDRKRVHGGAEPQIYDRKSNTSANTF